jgi:glycosyltransferase involved in cell wall biosynthesis
MKRFPGRLAVQQRVLPNYRAPFFDLLASACDGGMSLFTGSPRRSEGITTTNELQTPAPGTHPLAPPAGARTGVTNYQLGRNLHLFGGPFYLCYQRGLIDWLQKWNPDALIVEANPRYLSTPSALRWMHEQKKPVIGWGLGAPSPLRPSPRFVSAGAPLSASRRELGVRVWLSFISQLDAMIAYSQRGADEYAALGFPAEKIFVAQNAVSPSPASALPLRPETVDRFTILFVGRLQARKRIDSLLRACAQLDSSPHLVIVGDGLERENLEALAEEIYPRAEFVGARHGAELSPYFMKADLFVLPGTGGLAIQEAMSYGLPIIVAQGDGTQDDLVRTGNGWQIPPDDFEALVSTMKEALSDVERLRKMGVESYRIVKEEINIERRWSRRL